MGHPMAARLHRLGAVDLTVFDVSAAALDRAAGIGRPAVTIDAALAGADVIMTMLPADAHVTDVAAQVREHARDGATLVDFSTVHPETITAIVASLGPRIEMVSASCMKSVAAAVTGDLTLYLGGDPGLLASLDPLLAAMATTRIDVGSLANAKALKLVNNLMVASTNLAIAELAVLGASHGLSYGTLVAAFEQTGLGGWALVNQVKKHTLPNDLGPGRFSARYMAKDVTLAARMASDYRVPRFLAGPVLAGLRGADAYGYGNHYHPVVIRWLEKVANVTPADSDAAGTGTVTEDLCAALAALDRLIAGHGLSLAAAAGMPAGPAAEALSQASAGSAALAQAAVDPAGPDAVGRDRLAATLGAALKQALALAIRTHVPALVIESARDYLGYLAAGGTRE
jgi:3-hydroxyisobutyrate dehydrogenase-like beta-hydroxyacid dehydrogenase